MINKKTFLNLDKVKSELQKYGVEDVDFETEKIEKQIKSMLNSYKEKIKLLANNIKTQSRFQKFMNLQMI